MTEPSELEPTLRKALDDPMPNIVNIMINARDQRPKQEFGWLTR